MKIIKKMSAYLLVLAMMITMIPSTVFATASLAGTDLNINVGENYTLSYNTSDYRSSTEESNIILLDGFTITAKKIGTASVEVEKHVHHKVLFVSWWTWDHEKTYKVVVNGEITVTYNVNGGNAPATPMNEIVKASGTGQNYVIDTAKYTATRDASSTSKFYFIGWNPDARSKTGLKNIDLVRAQDNSGNVVLYAIWDEQKPTTINYVANKEGATVSAESDTTYSSINGSNYNIDTSKFYATKDMDDTSTYVFKGWSEKANSNKVVTQVTIKPDTKTLYGVWDKVDNVASARACDQNNNPISDVQRYVVPSDGTEVTIDQIAPAIEGKIFQRAEITEDIIFGQTITRPVKRLSYEREWYTPGIWYYGQGGIIKDLKTWFYYHPNSIIKCYYTDAPLGTFTITASAELINGEIAGTISNAGTTSVQEKSSVTYTITPNEGFKIKDVLVDGKSVGAVTSYKFESIKGNHTIKAIFEENTYVVSFDSKEGSEVPSQTIKNNSFAQEPKNPTRDGFTFVGWKANNMDELYSFDDTPVTQDVNLYAVWTEDMNLTASNVEVTYDGEEHGITIEGLPEGAEPDFGYDRNSYIDAGTYTVEFTVYANGYTTTTGSAILTIKPAQLTITADSSSKTYDGTALTDNGWQDTAPKGLVDGDTVLYVAVTGSAINVGTDKNVPSQAIIGRPKMSPPPVALLTSMVTSKVEAPRLVPTKEQLATVRSELAKAIAAYDPNNNEKPLQQVINEAIGVFYEDVTSNYEMAYVNGTLTINAASGGGHRHSSSTGGTTIQDETVPLAGTAELNKVDHFNYMNGYQDGTIKPLSNITREEVASIFYRMLTDDSRKVFDTQDQDFSDVKADRWSVGAIATLANCGIITGNSDGTFAATKPITRAEFAVVASRFDTLEENTDGISFTDISGNWAEKYIKSAVKKGWITGYSDGTFKPNQYITRAEAMALINRVLDRRVDAAGLVDGYKTFSDVKPSDWYYYEVVEATNNHDYAQRKSMSDIETWTKIKEDKTWTK